MVSFQVRLSTGRYRNRAWQTCPLSSVNMPFSWADVCWMFVAVVGSATGSVAAGGKGLNVDDDDQFPVTYPNRKFR